MAISWACPIGVEAYARTGRRAPAPRMDCPGCQKPMAFDGVYPRQVREAGVVHRIFVHRARCGRCGFGDALLPSFVVRRRRDSAFAVGAAVLERCGVELPAEAPLLYAGTPARTVRSWRQRFSGQADDLSMRFSALCAQWGGHLPWVIPKDPSARAAVAMGAAWQARRRRAHWGLPGAWLVANVLVGGKLLSTRVDLPWPIRPAAIGRSRGP